MHPLEVTAPSILKKKKISPPPGTIYKSCNRVSQSHS